MYQRPRIVWITAGIAISLLLPVCGSLICRLLVADFRFSHLPIHSLVESLGGLMAVAIAAMLIAERTRRDDAVHFVWMASALIGMGVLDLYHAAVLPGNSFVWLHSTATFVGGFFFALVWLPSRTMSVRFASGLPWVVLVVAVVLGGAFCCPWVPIPTMTFADGEFTLLARGLNIAGGLGFFAAGAFFARRFQQRADPTDWLFAAHTMLFGVAGILFELSALWDAAWWWWHILRLLAYLAAFSFAVRAYLDAEQAEAESRKAVIQRDQFLAMLSHELRNPLSAVLNGLGVLEHTAADHEAVTSAPGDTATGPPHVDAVG